MAYQILGIDPTQIVAATGIPEFPLGQIGEDQNGNRYIYGRANSAITLKFPVRVSTGFDFTASGNAQAADAVALVTLADNEYAWFQISGVCSAVNLATGITAGEFLSALTDANGDFVAVVAINEGGATNHTGVGKFTVRAKALEDEDSGVASVYLYNWM